MRKCVLVLICLALLSFVWAAPERRVALVIGNSDYLSTPLKNPVNDARAVERALKDLDFSVTCATNVQTMQQTVRLIRDFGIELQKGGVGLFYYAGHGVQIDGNNYLIPTRADIQKETDVELEGVDLDRVLNEMQYARNMLNIIVLDACRDNPYAGRFRTSQRGLATISTVVPDCLIAFATQPNGVALDGEGQNGIFTEELLKSLKIPDLSITQIMMKTRDAVRTRTNDAQLPWETSLLTKDFYFLRADQKPATQPKVSDPSEDRDADKAWRSSLYDNALSRYFPFKSKGSREVGFASSWNLAAENALIGNLTSSSALDVVLTDKNRCVIVDQNGTLIRQISLPEAGSNLGLLADIDDDGFDEIFITSPGDRDYLKLWIYNAQGSLVKSIHRTSYQIINQKGKQETITIGRNSSWTPLSVFWTEGSPRLIMKVASGWGLKPRGIEMMDIQTGNCLWYFEQGGGGDWLCTTNDLNSDGLPEISLHWFTSHNGAWGRGYLGNAPTMTDSDNWSVLLDAWGKPLWAINRGSKDHLWHASGDLDGDKVPDLIEVNGHGSYSGDNTIAILDTQNGNIKKSARLPLRSINGVAIGDIDSNGKDEVVIGVTDGNSSKLLVLDKDLATKYSKENVGSPMVLADLNGDDKAEIICNEKANGNKGIVILSYDLRGATALSDLSAISVYNCRVTDLDGDGKNDLIFSGSNGKVYCYKGK